MSKLTDQISYLRGLAEGMKLNPDKDSHRLILGMLEVLNEVGTAFDALAEAHGELAEAHEELSEYVQGIDENLAELEDAVYDEEEPEDSEEEEEGEPSIQYECPHCGSVIEIDPDEADFEEDALCPACGKPLFPEISTADEEEEKPSSAELDGEKD